MPAAPAKFNFDLDLGHRAERNSVLTESAMAALVANARAEGQQAGFAEGQRSATVQAAQRLAIAAQAIADRTASLNAALDDNRNATLADAVSLAAAIGKKLAHHLLAAEPASEIEALIADCLATLDSVPHLVIRCNPELADAVREIATTRIATSGFTGRLVVLGDPDKGIDDAKIEWADGGVARDRAALEAEVDQRIAAFLAARRGRPHDTGPGGTP